MDAAVCRDPKRAPALEQGEARSAAITALSFTDPRTALTVP